MTSNQENQWKLFACVPRCIIKLAEINGHPVTPDDFCSQFEHLFLNPTQQYGLLRIGDIYTTLKPLLLPGHDSDSNDYSTVENAVNNKHLVLLMSHVDLNPGATGVLHHCSVLTRMDATGFTIWTPTQNDGDVYQDLTKADWTDKTCWGYILE